ncbi:ParM/StbA family protein [Paenibacillus sedimenti]|uniref:ParM/StbA family protein n=1 Tax=Paenibacillus sedimenti TaxID=2770274 RepID=UPI00289B1F42|nr:hypothetical protein [Paenibacillus sedimenti]
MVIYSPSLSQRNQRYFVGHLALEHEDNLELEDTDNKAVSDQSLVVALTVLAYQGLMNQGSGGSDGYGSTVEVEYVLGTGLPVRAFAKFNQQFEQRLVGEHEVTFLSTPQLHNRNTNVPAEAAGTFFIQTGGTAIIFLLLTGFYYESW